MSTTHSIPRCKILGIRPADVAFLSFAQALFLSPKDNTEWALAVLDAASCNVWVKPRKQPCLPLVEEFLHQRPMRVLDIPEVDELLDAEFIESFPYDKAFNEATQDPFCLLHTSGTTGVPKPISWSPGLIGTMDAVRLLPPTESDDGLAPWTSLWREGDRMYSSFPMSHVRVMSSIALANMANCMRFKTYRVPVSWTSSCLPSSACTAFWDLRG